MKILKESKIQILTEKAIEVINSSLEEHKNQPILLLVSGGSALKLLEGIQKNFLGAHITISVLDERYSKDPSINNFEQLMQTGFYKNALDAKCKFIDTRILNNETIQELSNRFDKLLKNWKLQNPQGCLLITQGIGPDGHTSGIMPFPEDRALFKTLFNDEDLWVVGYDAGNKNQYALRVSTTIFFLRNIVDESIVYVTGENKKEALQRITNVQLPISDEKIADVPGRVIHQMKKIDLFSDIVS